MGAMSSSRRDWLSSSIFAVHTVPAHITHPRHPLSSSPSNSTTRCLTDFHSLLLSTRSPRRASLSTRSRSSSSRPRRRPSRRKADLPSPCRAASNRPSSMASSADQVFIGRNGTCACRLNEEAADDLITSGYMRKRLFTLPAGMSSTRTNA